MPRLRAHSRRSTAALTATIDPRLEEMLRAAVAVGGVLGLLWPGARDTHAAIGWLPLWLFGMPLVAWWAAHGFGFPGAR